MGFFDRFKRAMGFGPEDDEYNDVEGIDATVTPLRERNLRLTDGEPSADPLRGQGGEPAASREARAAGTEPADEAEATADTAVIFERVVEIFNDSLPGFLQKSVDPARERQALFDALDGSVKDYFNRLERNVERRLQGRFELDRRRLQEQIENLRQKAVKDEEDTSNAKNLQLSAERQKRALSERVHDLEKQIATLEAENEQYILENKSMANKLRMAAIVDRPDMDNPDAEALVARLEEERARLDEEREALARDKGELDKERSALLSDKESLASQKEALESEKKALETDRSALVSGRSELETGIGEMEQVKARLEAAHAELEAEKSEIASARSVIEETKLSLEQARAGLDAEKAVMEAGKAELEKEIERLRNTLEQARTKDELSRAMVNDLNSRAAEARITAEEKEKQAATLQEELARANEQVALLTGKLATAQEDLKVVREVQEQVARLEESQRVSDANIRRQRDELLEKDELLKAKDADLIGKNTTLRIKDETIHRLEDQTDSLRRSIENLQYEKSQAESALRSEIERLKALKGVKEAAVQAEPVAETVIPDVAEDTLPDLTLEFPELKTPDDSAPRAPKPRRGRPPKQKEADADIPPMETPAADRSASQTPESKSDKKEEEGDFALLDSTDWLIAEPAPKPRRQKRQAKAEQADDAFGYKEPLRQDPPDNPAQMLLW